MTVLVPIGVIVLINIILFTLIARQHFSCFCFKRVKITRNLSKSSTIRYRQRLLSMIMTCFVNMGLTWVFAFLAIIPGDSKDLFLIIFCILNSFQGFFILIAYIVLSKIRYTTSKLFDNKAKDELEETSNNPVENDNDDLTDSNTHGKEIIQNNDSNSSIVKRESIFVHHF